MLRKKFKNAPTGRMGSDLADQKCVVVVVVAVVVVVVVVVTVSSSLPCSWADWQQCMVDNGWLSCGVIPHPSVNP